MGAGQLLPARSMITVGMYSCTRSSSALVGGVRGTHTGSAVLAFDVAVGYESGSRRRSWPTVWPRCKHLKPKRARVRAVMRVEASVPLETNSMRTTGTAMLVPTEHTSHPIGAPRWNLWTGDHARGEPRADRV